MWRQDLRFVAVLLMLGVSRLVLSQATDASQAGLHIVADSPLTFTAGDKVHIALAVEHGFPPYTWKIVTGTLPSGLKLHGHSGVILGVASHPGEYKIRVSVTDSSVPAAQAEREITIAIVAGLTIEWKQPPRLQGNTITGSAVVTNQTGHSLDLTVIIVAVNTNGRATTLGYQHFVLVAQKASPEIPFGSSPGAGTYLVRADAVAHPVHGHVVYRAHQESSGLNISQP